jgi:oligopeptide/dipeptide ABC transporter ATP-binding protein
MKSSQRTKNLVLSNAGGFACESLVEILLPQAAGASRLVISVLLEVSDLRVSFPARSGRLIPVLRNVSFSIDHAEVAGLLGESGCGKSTTALAILGALPPGSRVSGSIRWNGRELLRTASSELRAVRGAGVSIIFQEPRLALHPTIRVGDQIADVLRAHSPRGLAIKDTVLELLRRTGLVSSAYNAYPHEMSGGELQRISIAQAIACRPSLIVADEPTASLDTITQAEILGLFRELRNESDAGVLFISHHPATLRGLADRVFVMYAGEVVECGKAEDILANPLHPYTRALLKAMPPPPGVAITKRLPAIPGEPAPPGGIARGCVFAPRCAEARADCREVPPVYVKQSPSRMVLCHLYEQ